MIDPQTIATPGATWFELVWGIAWAILVAMGGALWKTKANNEDLQILEKAARDYTDRIVAQVYREIEQRHHNEITETRSEIRTQLLEMQRDIKSLLQQRHSGRAS